MPFHVRLMSPERTLKDAEVDAASLPTPEGQLSILPLHAPLVALLSAGTVSLKSNGVVIDIAVDRGFVEVNAAHELLILADVAQHAEELDIEQIEAAKTRAEEVMKQLAHRQDEQAFAAAAAGLEHELARYRLAVKHRHSRHQAINTVATEREDQKK